MRLNYQPLTFTGYWKTQNQIWELYGCCSSKKAIETLMGPAGRSKTPKLSTKTNPKCWRKSPPSLWLDTHFSTASYKNRVLRTDTCVESINFMIFSFHIQHWGWLSLHFQEHGQPLPPGHFNLSLGATVTFLAKSFIWNFLAFPFSLAPLLPFKSSTRTLFIPTMTFISDCSIKDSQLKRKNGWTEQMLISFKMYTLNFE